MSGVCGGVWPRGDSLTCKHTRKSGVTTLILLLRERENGSSPAENGCKQTYDKQHTWASNQGSNHIGLIGVINGFSTETHEFFQYRIAVF
jgi:hypothetical protein